MALAERKWKEEKEVLLVEVSSEKKSHQQTLEALQSARARVQELENQVAAVEEEVKLLRDISENSTQFTQIQEQEVTRLGEQLQQLQAELDAERYVFARSCCCCVPVRGMSACARACVPVRVHVCLCVACLPVRVHVCLCVCMCACAYACG